MSAETYKVLPKLFHGEVATPEIVEQPDESSSDLQVLETGSQRAQRYRHSTMSNCSDPDEWMEMHHHNILPSNDRKPLKLTVSERRGRITKGTESSEPSINFQVAMAVSFRWCRGLKKVFRKLGRNHRKPLGRFGVLNLYVDMGTLGKLTFLGPKNGGSEGVFPLKRLILRFHVSIQGFSYDSK